MYSVRQQNAENWVFLHKIVIFKLSQDFWLWSHLYEYREFVHIKFDSVSLKAASNEAKTHDSLKAALKEAEIHL